MLINAGVIEAPDVAAYALIAVGRDRRAFVVPQILAAEMADAARRRWRYRFRRRAPQRLRMKRFYKDVAVAPAEGGWRVTLDGRGIKTPHGARANRPHASAG